MTKFEPPFPHPFSYGCLFIAKSKNLQKGKDLVKRTSDALSDAETNKQAVDSFLVLIFRKVGSNGTIICPINAPYVFLHVLLACGCLLSALSKRIVETKGLLQCLYKVKFPNLSSLSISLSLSIPRPLSHSLPSFPLSLSPLFSLPLSIPRPLLCSLL
jgi:hypothetical protein